MTSNVIRWGGRDFFTHMLIVGPPRSGKTATLLKPMIYQLLLAKKRGVPLGLSVIEPKGDMAQMVADMCRVMDIPYTHVDPLQESTHTFNPMQGDIDDVAEATVSVLKSMFGKQEAFFATVQELSARYVTKLLKELQGDKLDLQDVLRALRDPKLLEMKVKELKREKGPSDLVEFFEHELLGSLKEKYQQFVIGLRAQLENLTSNRYLQRVMTGESDINLDSHFEHGGVLGVNTAMGKLGRAGDAFGQFVIMHLQNATFRRPGTEGSRIPHFMIIDEFSRYINPDVERFLSAAPEYKVAGILAVQSLGQLEVESGKIPSRAMKQAIISNCRNKIAFGGLGAQDAKEFAEEFGKKQIILRQATFSHRALLPRLFPDSYRDTEKEEYRFFYTQLMDGLPRFHYIAKLLQDGHPQPPVLAKGDFVPRDWRDRLDRTSSNKQKAIWNKVKVFLQRRATERTDYSVERMKGGDTLHTSEEIELDNQYGPSMNRLNETDEQVNINDTIQDQWIIGNGFAVDDPVYDRLARETVVPEDEEPVSQVPESVVSDIPKEQAQNKGEQAQDDFWN